MKIIINLIMLKFSFIPEPCSDVGRSLLPIFLAKRRRQPRRLNLRLPPVAQ
ncbi:hypothetical protein KCP74_14560 [Salmonella enterica subsp. enterica]|nr:hypothetical protein KCP74_14560 [Salmonella enterica subsp. enterica]